MQPTVMLPAMAHWLFPGGPSVIYQMALAKASLNLITDEERSQLSRAVPKRQLEFAAGRACARAGLEALGFDVQRVPVGADRMPAWPDRVVGSISHDAVLACAVVGERCHWRSLGIDVEGPHRLNGSAAEMICRESERDQLPRWPAEIDGIGLLFSAKESFFKCYYPIEREFLGFQDIALEFRFDNRRRGRFSIGYFNPTKAWRSPRRIEGRWVLDFDRIYTSAYLAASPDVNP